MLRGCISNSVITVGDGRDRRRRLYTARNTRPPRARDPVSHSLPYASEETKNFAELARRTYREEVPRSTGIVLTRRNANFFAHADGVRWHRVKWDDDVVDVKVDANVAV